MWGVNAVDAYLDAFIKVLDAAMGYLEPSVFGLYDLLMILGIAALSCFLLSGGRAYFDRLGPRVLYLGMMGFLLKNFGTIAQAIADSFVFLGLAASGGAMAEYTFWHPGLLAAFGDEAAEPLRHAAAKVSLFDWGGLDLIFWYGIAAFLLKLSYYILAVAVFVAIIAFKLGSVAAFVLAASAALPRFAWMASGGFGFVISAGVGLFSYALIISVVNSVTTTLFSGAEPATDAMISLAILVAIVNFGLVLLGPSMIRSVMSGVANMGLGAAATAVGAAAGMIAAPVAGGLALSGAARGLASMSGSTMSALRMGGGANGSGAMPKIAANAAGANANGSGGSIGNMGGKAAAGAKAVGGDKAAGQLPPPGWSGQKVMPPLSLRGISSIHAARALVPDGTDQGGGMSAPTNPERN